MNWNNDKLNAIQAIEYQLLDNPSGSSPLFTSFIHNTSEWIDREYEHKTVHINPRLIEMNELVDRVAEYIKQRVPVNIAIGLVGKEHKWFRARLTEENNATLNKARQIRNNKK